MDTESIYQLLSCQLDLWPLARANYDALRRVRTRTLRVRQCNFRLQYNPGRIRSAAAKVDEQTIARRPCFLCPEHLPEEQLRTPWDDGFQLLLNPYPIFPAHFTLPSSAHTPQLLTEQATKTFIRSACKLQGFVLFYNGPRCGASAPDHLHFQAGERGFLPLEKEVEMGTHSPVMERKEGCLTLLKDYPCPVFVLRSHSEEWSNVCLKALCDNLPSLPGEAEARFNLLAWYDKTGWTLCLIPRTNHRPRCFYAEGKARTLISPASVDLAGVFVTAREEDFLKLTEDDLLDILHEVTPPHSDMERLARLIG